MNANILGIVMSLIFLLLGVMEASTNPINAFVLFVTALIFFRSIQRGESYIFSASLVASTFALLSLLTLIASYANSLLLGEEFRLSFEWALVGLVCLPMLCRKTIQK